MPLSEIAEIIADLPEGQVLKSYDMETLLPDSFGPENIGKSSPMST